MARNRYAKRNHFEFNKRQKEDRAEQEEPDEYLQLSHLNLEITSGTKVGACKRKALRAPRRGGVSAVLARLP